VARHAGRAPGGGPGRVPGYREAVRPTILPTGEPLAGRWVRLDVLGEADIDQLYPILGDPAVYADGYVMHRRPASLNDARDLARSLFLAAQGQADGNGAGRTAYAIRLVSDGEMGPAGTLVGTSSLSEADLRNESIHLGSTLYGPRWWGTQVNPESKLLLLAHCFDDCGYGRVKIQTDALNTRSQAAIAKLGATREGVLRRHTKREDGTFRDTVVYSVLKDEWPEVKARLAARLR
jgi:N-acetyltransferase